MRPGLLPAWSFMAGFGFGLASLAMVGELGAFSACETEPRFSCELLGSNASLEGTGVESFCAGFAFGKKLALVSFRQELDSEETCARAAGEGVAAGDDFAKKDMIDRCLADEDTEAAAFAGCRAGVRVALALSPAMFAGGCNGTRLQQKQVGQ